MTPCTNICPICTWDGKDCHVKPLIDTEQIIQGIETIYGSQAHFMNGADIKEELRQLGKQVKRLVKKYKEVST